MTRDFSTSVPLPLVQPVHGLAQELPVHVGLQGLDHQVLVGAQDVNCLISRNHNEAWRKKTRQTAF